MMIFAVASLQLSAKDTIPASFGGNFCLQSDKGQHCLAQHQGRIVLLYFGYTAFPDVCPTSLAVLADAYRLLPEVVARDTDMMMITLDPERDGLAKLRDYLAFFHPNMRGLTGSEQEISAVAKQYGASYQKASLSSSQLDYAIDHSASIYLIDTQGNLMGQFRHGTSVEDVAKGIIYAYQTSKVKQ
jgi:protein SCO1/2